MDKYQRSHSGLMANKDVIEKLEDVRKSILEIEEGLISTYEPNEDDIKAYEEAMREYKAGKL